MKRWILLLSCLLLTTGCAYAAINEQEDSYLLYFREAELREASGSDAIRAVPVCIKPRPETTEELATELVEKLMERPGEEGLGSVLPEGTELCGLEVRNGQALLDFSRPYASLSGIDLTLADYAIALTLTQIPEISSVKITVQGHELSYREQQVFCPEDVLLSPQEDVVSTAEVSLYFPNEAGELVAEQRTLDLFEGDTQPGAVARALEEGPESRELNPLFPEGFQVKTLRLEDELCYVNLSSQQLAALDKRQVRQVLESLNRSLCSLETIKRVEFLVDGEYSEDTKSLYP